MDRKEEMIENRKSHMELLEKVQVGEKDIFDLIDGASVDYDFRTEDGSPLTPEYCTQNDGDCSTCSLVNYGRDCRNNQI